MKQTHHELSRYERLVHQVRALRVLVLLVVSCIASVHQGQVVRVPIAIPPSTPSPSYNFFAMESSGDVSACVWANFEEVDIWLSLSDGRATEWSAPIRVNESDLGTQNAVTDIAIDGRYVYIVWPEARGSGGYSLYSNVYDLELNTFLGEEGVHDDTAAQVNTYRMAVAEFDGINVGYVAYAAVALGEPSRLYLRQFIDGKLGDVQLVSPVDANISSYRVAASQERHALACTDNRNGAYELYLSASNALGFPNTFAPDGDLLLSEPTALGEPILGDLVHEGDAVLVVWRQVWSGSGVPVELVERLSIDGGVSFGPSVAVMPAASSEKYVQPRAVLLENGDHVVTWLQSPEECPSGVFFDACGDIRVRASIDGGASLLPWVQLSSAAAEGVIYPRLSLLTSTREVVVLWEEYLGNGPYSAKIRASLSGDVGLTWKDALALNGEGDLVSSIPGGAHISLEANALYRNFIASWRRVGPEPPPVMVGGFRPQSLTPVGWEVGPASVSFEFSDFLPGDDDLVFALLAFGSGSTAAPDGRELGLKSDALFAGSIQLGFSGVTSAFISPSGEGSTLDVPVFLPAGVPLYGVAVGLDIGAGGVVVGSITDVGEVLP